MAKKPQRGRGKPENPRKYKKKTSPLLIEKVEYVDYKDVDLLSRFMSDRAKIRNMRVSGNNRQQQLEIAKAIKISREMALLPYAKRVASTGRPGRGRDGGRDVVVATAIVVRRVTRAPTARSRPPRPTPSSRTPPRRSTPSSKR